jgi:uncharacterized DUF497 family protein
MIPLVLSPRVRQKLEEKHNVKEQEVRECFFSYEGEFLIDDNEDHLTDPPTLWFICETYRGRLLKIIFVSRDGNIYLKSAYDANKEAQRIYAEKIKQME